LAIIPGARVLLRERTMIPLAARSEVLDVLLFTYLSSQFWLFDICLCYKALNLSHSCIYLSSLRVRTLTLTSGARHRRLAGFLEVRETPVKPSPMGMKRRRREDRHYFLRLSPEHLPGEVLDVVCALHIERSRPCGSNLF
jgi:hypothetical protein